MPGALRFRYGLHSGKAHAPLAGRADHAWVHGAAWFADFPREESLPHSALVGACFAGAGVGLEF